MGERVTKRRFLQILTEGAPMFSQLGFTQTQPAVFLRQRGEVVQGFFFTPNPSFTHFHVPVGVDIPTIAVRTNYIDFGGAQHPTLLVSRWLGEFKTDCRQWNVYYHFATVREMREKFPQVYADFIEQAEPWLAELTTAGAVAKEFYKWRVGPPSLCEPSNPVTPSGSPPGRLMKLLKSWTRLPPKDETRPPDPFAWAIYGWLLQEAGHPDEARSWLQKSYDFLQLPHHRRTGQLIPRTLPGSKPISLRPEEDRLIELLKTDLK